MSDDWLYGRSPGGKQSGKPSDPGSAPSQGSDAADATRPVPRQPRPDETRVMPTMPRTQGRSSAPPPSGRPTTATAAPTTTPTTAPRRTTPPPVKPVSPPGTPSEGGASSGFHLPKFKLRYLWILLALWLVYLIAVPFFAWSHVSKVDAFPSGARPADQDGTNYLIVGSDSRKGMSPQLRKELHTGNAAGQRTDTIMLLHTGSGPSLLMSLPRDSYVPIPGHGSSKINAAFAWGGPKLLIKTVEQNTGIHIDHYLEIGFGGLVNVVDAVGGITICPTHAMNDKLANLHVKKGCQPVDGRVALAYARSRHADPRLGDIERGNQQRQVIAEIGHKAFSPWTFINPIRYWNFNMAAADSVKVDQDLSVFGAGRALWGMTHAKLRCVVPISDLYVHWDPTRSKQMFRAIINNDTSSIGKGLCTQSGLPRS